MQTRSIKQVEAVTGNTPQELAANYNEAMKRLEGCNPKDEWHGDTVYIYYYVTDTVPESLSDECKLSGEEPLMCGSCPHCVKKLNKFGQVDIRYKWATCGKTGDPVMVSQDACDIRYAIAEAREKEGKQEGMNKDIKIKMIQFDVDQKMLAKKLGVTQPRVSQMLNHEMSSETHERVMEAIEACALGTATEA